MRVKKFLISFFLTIWFFLKEQGEDIFSQKLSIIIFAVSTKDKVT